MTGTVHGLYGTWDAGTGLFELSISFKNVNMSHIRGQNYGHKTDDIRGPERSGPPTGLWDHNFARSGQSKQSHIEV